MSIQNPETPIGPREVLNPFFENKWVQLIIAIIGMIMIANLQYAWTLFVPEVVKSFNSTKAAVQMGFSLFIAFESWGQPVAGYFMDRYSPRALLTVAALMIGIGWAGMGLVKSLGALYFLYSMAGVGAALIYSGSIASGVRWFEASKRGMASGLVAAAFGSGAALFIPFIAIILKKQGYSSAFITTGVIQGIIALITAQFIRFPAKTKMSSSSTAKARASASQRDFTTVEMFKTAHFWIIYLMFLFICTGGMIVTAQTKPFGTEAGIAASIIVTAATINTIANGAGRIIWGMISDKLGRYQTMFVAFTINAIAMALVPFIGHNALMFVFIFALIMFTWGELYSLFPAVNADIFGTTYAATNYGFIYSAKGLSGIVGGFVAALVAQMSGWTPVFLTGAVMSLLAGLGALLLRSIPKPVPSGIKSGSSGFSSQA